MPDMTAMGVTSLAALPAKMAGLQRREDAELGAARAKDPAPGGGRQRGRRAAPGPAHQQQPPPLAVARRNARERNRVKQVNNGFATLRQHIPAAVAEAYLPPGEAAPARGKKLSKVETLRMAVDYIRGLQRLLSGEQASGAASPAPGGGDDFSFADDDLGSAAGADDDLGSADGSASSPFVSGAASPDNGRYLQQLYVTQPPPLQFAPPPLGAVKQERVDEEPPPVAAVDRAVLEMMWWEQARRLRLISAAPQSPS